MIIDLLCAICSLSGFMVVIEFERRGIFLGCFDIETISEPYDEENIKE